MAKSDYYYPAVGFFFQVSFTGLGIKSGNDVKFQSVSGLTVELETETIKEGGENRFEHAVPLRKRYTDLVLKRGVFRPQESEITAWCKDAFENMIIRPIDLEVILFNENKEPLVHWQVVHAWPNKWTIGDLNADKGEVLIETFELRYNYFSIK